MTPREALGTIQSRLEAYESHVGNDGLSPEMMEAVDTLGAFITQVEEHGSTDLEWGEPGDCYDRMVNDDDILDAFRAAHDGLPEMERGAFATTFVSDVAADMYVEWAKAQGFGRHYGDPHCIWCLQAD